MKNKRLGFLIFVLAATLQLLPGQTFTGTMTGIVADPNGGAIPHAKVQARNEATGEVRVVLTGGDGLYVFSQLPPGTYEVSAEMQGFRKSCSDRGGASGKPDAGSELLAATGRSDTDGRSHGRCIVLDTQSANRAVTLDQQTVLDLPVNARNPFQLVHVNAGVIAVRTGISQATQDQNHNRFSMNGGRGQAGLTLIDGVPAAAVDWGGLIASPSVDSVQEVNIQRNQFDAQFGKSDGGAVNMITRGGTNDFPRLGDTNSFGTICWTQIPGRNNRSGLKRVQFQRNQFGGTFGGADLEVKKIVLLRRV